MKDIDLIANKAVDYIDSLVSQYAKEPASENKEEIKWAIRHAIDEAKANVTELELELAELLGKRGYGCLAPGTFVTESTEIYDPDQQPA
jgi:hypothetical protein